MWSSLLGLFGSNIFKGFLLPTLLGVGLAILGASVANRYGELVKAESDLAAAEAKVEDLLDANESLLGELQSQEERHNDEIARLEADRKALDVERKAIQKRAFIEAGRLKDELKRNKESSNYYNIPIPDGIKRVL